MRFNPWVDTPAPQQNTATNSGTIARAWNNSDFGQAMNRALKSDPNWRMKITNSARETHGLPPLNFTADKAPEEMSYANAPQDIQELSAIPGLDNQMVAGIPFAPGVDNHRQPAYVGDFVNSKTSAIARSKPGKLTVKGSGSIPVKTSAASNPYIDEMKAMIERKKGKLGDVEGMSDKFNEIMSQRTTLGQTDLSPTMAFLDDLYGGNISKGYRKPASSLEDFKQARASKVHESQMASSIANDYGKLHQLSKSDNWKEKMDYKFKHDYILKQLANKNKKGAGLKELYVPGIGHALTKTDAKELKNVQVAKDTLQTKVSELIDLRKEFGGETWNRVAVRRGKQLSKEILLQYKNLAKLGVLSKSDEDIVNAINASDPLAFSAHGMVGEEHDPILQSFITFSKDIDTEFDAHVRSRVDTSQPLEYKGSRTPSGTNKPFNPLSVEQLSSMTYEQKLKLAKQQGLIK